MALFTEKYTPLGGSGTRHECGEPFTGMSSWIEYQVCHNKFNCSQCEFARDDRDEFKEHLGIAHMDKQPLRLKIKL